MKNINSIFVYGTLQPGMQNDEILKNLNGNWKKGYVLGKLLNLDTGENYGYPVLELDNNGSKIYGMILESKDIEKNLPGCFWKYKACWILYDR